MMSSVPNYYAGYSNYSSPRYVDPNGQEVLDPSVAPASVSLAPSQDTASFSTQAPAPAEALAPEEKKNGWLAPTLAVIGGVGLTLLTLAATGNLGGAKKAAEETLAKTPEVLDNTADAVKNAVKQTPEAVENVVESTAKTVTGSSILDGIDRTDPKVAAVQLAQKFRSLEPHTDSIKRALHAHANGKGYTGEQLATALETTTLDKIKLTPVVDPKDRSKYYRAFVEVAPGKEHELDFDVAQEIQALKSKAYSDEASERLYKNGRVLVKEFDGEGFPIHHIVENPKVSDLEHAFTHLLTQSDPKKAAFDRKLATDVAAQMGHTLILDGTGTAKQGLHALQVKKPDGTLIETINIPNFHPDDTSLLSKYQFESISGNTLSETEVKDLIRKSKRPGGEKPQFTVISNGKTTPSTTPGGTPTTTLPKIRVNTNVEGPIVSVGLI